MAGTALGASITAIANGVGQGLKNFQAYSGQAAARANGVSAAAQKAQGNFNQASANNANAIGTDRIAEQYGFNSGQAAMANAFSREMWDITANYNSEEAEKQRQWLEMMESTKYQRAVKDMEAAGLNPILAVTGGGISTGGGGGSAASMSSPTGAMASGGLMNGISASEGNYSGQMEYMGGMLGLLSAAISGLASAQTAMGQMGQFGQELGKSLGDFFDPTNWLKTDPGSIGDWALDKLGIPHGSTKNPNNGSHGKFGSDFKNVYRDSQKIGRNHY